MGLKWLGIAMLGLIRLEIMECIWDYLKMGACLIDYSQLRGRLCSGWYTDSLSGDLSRKFPHSDIALTLARALVIASAAIRAFEQQGRNKMTFVHGFEGTFYF